MAYIERVALAVLLALLASACGKQEAASTEPAATPPAAPAASATPAAGSADVPQSGAPPNLATAPPPAPADHGTANPGKDSGDDEEVGGSRAMPKPPK